VTLTKAQVAKLQMLTYQINNLSTLMLAPAFEFSVHEAGNGVILSASNVANCKWYDKYELGLFIVTPGGHVKAYKDTAFVMRTATRVSYRLRKAA